MIKQGHVEPALVGPWTMGRDKKNPKSLDPLASVRVGADHRLSETGALAWVSQGFGRPR